MQKNQQYYLHQKREILNNEFNKQYKKLLEKISYSSTSINDLKYNDLLPLCYYLILQDRFDEALDIYNIIMNNNNISNKCESNICHLCKNNWNNSK